MTRIKITTAESETVERAYYESQSYEAIMSILSRLLKADGNEQTAKVLSHYTDMYRLARMKLQMSQNMVLTRYGLTEPGRRYRFDFEREEVCDEAEA